MDTAQAAAEPLKVFMSQEQAVGVSGKVIRCRYHPEICQGRHWLPRGTGTGRYRMYQDAGNDFPADAWKQLLSEPGAPLRRSLTSGTALRSRLRPLSRLPVSVPYGKGKAGEKADPGRCV